MQLVQLRQNLLDSYHLGVVDGRSKSQLRGGKRRIGIIDGSGFGQLLASCFEDSANGQLGHVSDSSGF